MAYWISFCIIGILGLVFLAVGYFWERSQSGFIAEGMPVQVKVVYLHEVHDSDGGNTYKPEYEITSGVYAGKRYVGTVSSSPPVHRVGYAGPGLYDPDSGAIQSIKAAKNHLLFAILFSSLGAGLLIGAALFGTRAGNL